MPENSIRKFFALVRSNMTINLIGPLVLQLILLGVLIGEAGILSHTLSFRREHADESYHLASLAVMEVNGNELESYAKGEEKEDYFSTKKRLDAFCKKAGVTIVYVILPDREDYGSFVSVFNCVNNEVGDTDYVEWEPGYKRNTTNEEYAEKYRRICEYGSEEEVVYRVHPPDSQKPHITTMVPVKDFAGEVAGILCIQRPISELKEALAPYMVGVLILTLILAIAGAINAAAFVRKLVIIPIKKISEEAVRFANDRKTDKPLGSVSRFRDLEGLARAVDSMEKDIVDYVDHLEHATAERERIKTELSLASGIQKDMLPSRWPAFPDRRDFDIYAVMDPAKEVGGDFYDFFLIDEDHLYMAMADVSGKGIPASLFMMSSMIILADHAVMGKSPGQILKAGNAAICKHNREMMFITAWVGILELSSGIMKCANAGHEYPVIKHGRGDFELLNDEHDICLGIMEGTEYGEYELKFEKDSVLFVYTDGLAEAMDPEGKMFGTERIVAALNEVKEAEPKELLNHMRSKVNDYVREAEQFDDLTMLGFKMK